MDSTQKLMLKYQHSNLIKLKNESDKNKEDKEEKKEQKKVIPDIIESKLDELAQERNMKNMNGLIKKLVVGIIGEEIPNSIDEAKENFRDNSHAGSISHHLPNNDENRPNFLKTSDLGRKNSSFSLSE